MKFSGCRFYCLLIVMLISGCTEEVKVPGFDSSVWKEDRSGCNGGRTAIMLEFPLFKDKLLGLSEKQILQLMGKANRNELKSRGQKFFFYYYTSGAQCGTGGENGKEVFIRLSALNKVTEVNYHYQE